MVQQAQPGQQGERRHCGLEEAVALRVDKAADAREDAAEAMRPRRSRGNDSFGCVRSRLKLGFEFTLIFLRQPVKPDRLKRGRFGRRRLLATPRGERCARSRDGVGAKRQLARNPRTQGGHQALPQSLRKKGSDPVLEDFAPRRLDGQPLLAGDRFLDESAEVVSVAWEGGCGHGPLSSAPRTHLKFGQI